MGAFAMNRHYTAEDKGRGRALCHADRPRASATPQMVRRAVPPIICELPLASQAFGPSVRAQVERPTAPIYAGSFMKKSLLFLPLAAALAIVAVETDLFPILKSTVLLGKQPNN